MLCLWSGRGWFNWQIVLCVLFVSGVVIQVDVVYVKCGECQYDYCCCYF